MSIALTLWALMQQAWTLNWFSSSRSQKWDAMAAHEKQTYLETTTDKGNKRYVVLRTSCVDIAGLMNASFLDLISGLRTEQRFMSVVPVSMKINRLSPQSLYCKGQM